MTVEIRPCRDAAEFERAFLSIAQYFGMDEMGEERARFARLLPPEQVLAAWDGDEIVGSTGAFLVSLSVPGGALPCTGTTTVGVTPTHRRRGVLRAMMDAHLAAARERGHPLAALWASEEGIYGRFGYGCAAYAGELAVPREHAEFASPVEARGSVRLVGPEEALQAFPRVWEAQARIRPGMVMRPREWWEDRTVADPKERREGAGPKRFALLEQDGEPAGYAIYRHDQSFEAGISTGKILVVEAIAAEPDATAALWRFLLDIDWVATTSVSLVPPDHPLFFLLAQPRRARYRMGDGLWVRLVDVGEALSGRRYAGEGELVLEVRDELCPWNEGRWRLAGGVAERTDAAADLALGVAALGSAYLGGVGFAQLAQGGHVEELRSGALERADVIFRHGLHPWCPEIF